MVLELFSRPVLRGGVICKVLFWLYPSVIHLFWIERWRPGPIHREARDILAKEIGFHRGQPERARPSPKQARFRVSIQSSYR